MPMVSDDYFAAYTTGRIEATDNYIPLSDAAIADLARLLKDPDSYVYLTIRTELTLETVKASLSANVVVIERGLAGTQRQVHMAGATVCTVSPTMMAVMKDLICNYDCCADGNCQCIPPTLLGTVVNGGKLGQQYLLRMTVGGSQPCTMATPDGLPDWASAVYENGTIVVRGMPTAAGSFPVAFAVTNCNGTQVTALNYNIVIQD